MTDQPTIPTPIGGLPVGPQGTVPAPPAPAPSQLLDVGPPGAEPGYTTTEWWGKLAVQTVALLTLVGVIHPAPGVGDAMVGLVGMVGPEIGYAVSRGIRKRGTPG